MQRIDVQLVHARDPRKGNDYDICESARAWEGLKRYCGNLLRVSSFAVDVTSARDWLSATGGCTWAGSNSREDTREVGLVLSKMKNAWYLYTYLM